jgi:hydantoinase/carbamoylase family amidase
MQIKIDRIRRDIEAIAAYTSTPGSGATRLSFSTEYRQACDYVADAARQFGMSARYDAVGNLRMRLPGRSSHKPVVLVASHLDSVRNGGDFDGVLGVICGLEAVRTLVESGEEPERGVELISFVEEEGASFACPLAGSKAITGFLSFDDLATVRNAKGQSFIDAARGFGLKPENLQDDQLVPGAICAAFELHIEQGVVLENENIAVGIVDRIAGSENHRVRVTGLANHAGTTPMELRRDALAGTAEMITAVERIAGEPLRPRTVATVGRIDCLPNSANVVPGDVNFSIDVRDVETSAIESASMEIRQAVKTIARARKLDCSIELTGKSDPAMLSQTVASRLAETAGRSDIPFLRMHSGALHDAAMVTRVADAGFIFVPSRNGRSHCPEEWTDFDKIEDGANLLLRALLEYCTG